MSELNSFTSAQIKLADLLRARKRRSKPTIESSSSTTPNKDSKNQSRTANLKHSLLHSTLIILVLFIVEARSEQQYLKQSGINSNSNINHLHHQHQHQQVLSGSFKPLASSEQRPDLLRQQAHYTNIIPSTHFSYNEGRQSAHPSDYSSLQERSFSSSLREPDQPEVAATQNEQQIYKRSSAVNGGQTLTNVHHYAPLVNSFHSQSNNQHPTNQNPLRRRMMFEGFNVRWTAPQMVNELHPSNHYQLGQQQQQLSELEAHDSLLALNSIINSQQAVKAPTKTYTSAKNSADYEAKLLKQKQHIQYHDQWPMPTGNQAKCHKRTLNFCASVLPFNTTTFPNIIGDTNRFEVKRSLPFFGFLAKSSCNKRLDELLCLLLEPPCSIASGLALPPCKKFCRLALEGCNEYIPATLAMSSVFDCRQYPDSNDPSVCINLAQGNKCDEDQFKCPDKTCIPREYKEK